MTAAARSPAWWAPSALAAFATVAVVVAALAGQRVFGVFVVVAAAVALLALASWATTVVAAPVVPAAALPAVVMPALSVADPEGVVSRIPLFGAALLIITFVLVLLSQRRHGVTAGVAATCLLGLVVGLGASAFIALHAVDPLWVVAVVVLVGLPTPAGAVARTWRRYVPAWAARLAVLIVAAAVVAAVGPFPPLAVAALAVIASLATEAVRALLVAQLAPSAVDDTPGVGVARPPEPVAHIAVAALLVAPAAYLLAEAVR
jgi:hypothetical protein